MKFPAIKDQRILFSYRGHLEIARDQLKKRLLNLVDDFEAMVVFLGDMNRSTKEELNRQRSAIDGLNNRQLHANIDKAAAMLGRLRKETGATLPIGRYAKFLKANLPERDGSSLDIPVWMLEIFFKKYPQIGKLPLHATIQLDHRGLYKPQPRQLVILEATLFEDMCFFWNASCEINANVSDPFSAKRKLKERAALHRAAVSSAFYMVEAFCNGIALEVLLKRRDQLTEQEVQKLTEWDDKKGRPQYLSTRDKILHYPRLLLGVAAPPVQENNCSELAYFLNSAKQFRDSIVHANPAPNFETLEPAKGQVFRSLDHDETAMVVDSSIAVVDRIATAIGNRKAAFWLQPRQQDGLFHESVFD